MTAANDHDFQQLRGKFDEAMTPDASFAAKMEQLLQSEKPTQEERQSTVLASPPKQNAGIVVPPRRSHPLMIGAAVLTVFAVVIASVWVLSGDVLEGEYASAPGSIATLPADAPMTPGADIHLKMQPLMEAGRAYWFHTVNNDVLITAFYEANPTPGSAATLAVIDATSGDVVWKHEDMDLNQTSIFDGLLIGIEYEWETSIPSRNASTKLTAIDAESGAILWQVPLSSPGNEFDRSFHTAPIRVGDTVVIVQADGNVHGWNAQTGDVQWSQSFGSGENWTTRINRGEYGEDGITWMPVDAMAWKNQAVIVTGAGEVLVIDEDGNETSSWSVAPLEDERAFVTRLEIVPLADQALVIRDSQTHEGSTHSIFAFDPHNGEISWTRGAEGHVTVSVADDDSVAMNTHLWKQYPEFLRFFGLVGYSTFQFTWLDGVTGEIILETERGKLEAPPVTLTDGEYACTRTEPDEIICFNRAGTRHIIETDGTSDPALTNGVLFIPTMSGLYRVELP